MPKLRFFGVAVAAAYLFSLPGSVQAATPPDSIVPARTLSISGNVVVATSAKRQWVFITLAPRHPGLPLAGAFRAQYAKPLPSAFRLMGPARVDWTQGPGSPAPLSVLVVPKDGQPILFEVRDVYAGPTPPGVIVERPVGIAHYEWKPDDPTAPRTSAAFIKASTPVAECSGACASGGQGSSQCSSAPEPQADCSVTCGTGYYACCNGTGCVCCTTALVLAGPATQRAGARRCKPGARGASSLLLLRN